MTNMEILRAELTRDEGKVARLYRDSRGYWTVGIGHLMDKRIIGAHDELQARIWARGYATEDEIKELFDRDVTRKLNVMDQRMPWYKTLSPVRRRVLINMVFNLGIDGLLGFRNTLAKIKRGDYKGAAENMLKSLWAKQVKGRARRLAYMMEHDRVQS